MTNKDIVFQVMDNLNNGIYHGWEIENKVHSITYPKRPYISTVLKYVKLYCDISGAMFECLNRTESKYKYVSGLKIAGAILD